MSKCRKCGANFVGVPEQPMPEGMLCKYCEIKELRAEVERLRAANMAWAIGIEQNSINIVDMHRDEFKRIAALDVSDEIKGICKRAIETIEQKVPLIVQRDNANNRCDQWREVAEILAGAGTAVREVLRNFHGWNYKGKEKWKMMEPAQGKLASALAAYERLKGETTK